MVLFIRYMGQYRKPKHIENVKKVEIEELQDVNLEDRYTGDDVYSYHPIMAKVTNISGAVSVEYDLCDIEIV